MRPRHVTPAGKAPLGFVPQPRVLRTLDQISSELIDAETGGTWNPARPITLGGAAVPLLDLTTSGSVITGDVETVRGNSRGAQSGLEILGGANPSFPAFESARERILHVSFDTWQEERKDDDIGQPIYEFDPVYLAPKKVRVPNDGSDPMRTLSVVVPLGGAMWGAAIASVKFRYLVTRERTATEMPITQPKFRVLRGDGAINELTHDGTGPVDADGWLADSAADELEYNNYGLPREVTYTPNQNAETIAPTHYFVLQCRDEDNYTYLGNVFLGATIRLITIAALVIE